MIPRSCVYQINQSTVNSLYSLLECCTHAHVNFSWFNMSFWIDHKFSFFFGGIHHLEWTYCSGPMQVLAPLGDLPKEVLATQLVSPTLIIIGRVVALSHLWPFETYTSAIWEDPKAKSLSSATSFEPSRAGLNFSEMNEPRARKLRGPDPSLPSQNWKFFIPIFLGCQRM